MKKILFCVRDFSTGGVQKSLINLLNKLEPSILSGELSVDVLVIKKIGELLDNIPKCVNVIETNKSMWKFGVTNNQAKKIGKGFFIKRSFSALWAKLFGNRLLLKNALKKQDFLGEYDAVISYAVSISKKSLYAGWSEIALEKTKSKNKIVYIHNDFVASSLNNPFTISLVKKFDKIWFVSKSCQQSFCEEFGYLSNRTDFLYNTINVDEIVNKSQEKCDIKLDKSKFNFISVSRLSEEKAHLRTLKVLDRLSKEGFNFCWHVLGDGPMKASIENAIKQYCLEDKVILYGNQINPYKFIKTMDLLYLGSFNESFGLVLVDAMILGVPVMTTKTVSANEIVKDNGFICGNTEEEIYAMMKNVFTNKKHVSEIKDKLKHYKYENNDIVQKFLDLI